jgi:hypothetical protein
MSMPKDRSWPESLAASAAFRPRDTGGRAAQSRTGGAAGGAAEALFAEKGLLQTEMGEIGAAVGLAPHAVRVGSATGRWCWKRCSTGTWTG